MIASALLLSVAPLMAQATGENPKANQIRMLDYQRNLLLAMADSMPERLYRDKATPAQRDFAQQIHHAASVQAFIVGRALGGGASGLPDTAATLNSRAGLRRYITAAFDYSAGVLRSQTAAQRAATANLFGQSMPAWQVWDEIYTHTLWTAGQVVANFRKNGMAPPSFTFF